MFADLQVAQVRLVHDSGIVSYQLRESGHFANPRFFEVSTQDVYPCGNIRWFPPPWIPPYLEDDMWGEVEHPAGIGWWVPTLGCLVLAGALGVLGRKSSRS